MGQLTDEQRTGLREFLEQQGLSFKPLQDEMVDHLICDLEERMADGHSFEEAWHQAVGALPGNHFQLIQTEIMQTINKRFTVSQGLSIVALGFLLISTILKVLHMPGSGETLLLSFGFIAAALLTSSLTGIFLNKEKKGATRVLAVILGIVLLLIGSAFRILHMPGADEAVMLAVCLLIGALVINTIYVYQHASGDGNLLTFLHEKYSPGIERFLLLLLLPLTLYKIIAIASGPHVFIGNIILLVVTLGSGLQLIALTWRGMENDLSKRNTFVLTATIVSFLCLTLPFLGQALPMTFRVVLIATFSIVSAWLAYHMEEVPVKLPALIILCLVPVVFLGWALIRLHLIAASSHTIFFNLPILMLLVAGLFLCRKQGTMRTYMLVSLSGYLFEYMM